MQKGKRVNIGIIGCGSISSYHINALRLIPEAHISTYCDVDTAKAEAAAGVDAGWCADYHELLLDPAIDAVCILTPNYLHKEMTIAAAAAGKHIFVQKPMATSSQECTDMIEAAERNGVKLFQSYMHRYFEESRWIRDFLQDGGLGTIHSVRIRNAIPGSDYSSWQYDSGLCGKGGVMIDIGVHGVDLIQYLLGAIEEVISCSTRQILSERYVLGEVIHPDNEDYAHALYRLETGALVSHEMSWTQVAYCNRFWLEIHGEEGSAFLRSGYGTLAVCMKNGEMKKPELKDIPMGLRQHQEFIDCIMQDTVPPCNGLDGLQAIACIEKFREKAVLVR